jgi:hypothetical protein
MDSLTNPDSYHTESHLDALSDAHTASNHDSFLDPNTHSDTHALKTVLIPHML